MTKMIAFVTKRVLLWTLQEIWFCRDFSVDILKLGKNIFYHSECDPPKIANYVVKFHSTLIKLNESTDEIFARFKKGTRYEIKRAMREGFFTMHLNAESVKPEILYHYLKTLRAFAKSKGIGYIPKWKAEKLLKYRVLVISCLMHPICEHPLLYHAYIVDTVRGIARLLTSHNTESCNKVSRSLLGMGHRLLHWKDILWFKSLGFHIYDFGGISNDTSSGITRFKLSFGGEIKTFYNFVVVRWF